MEKKKKIKTDKGPVTLREKLLSNGNKSLYLDIYRDGKREYEFLKLYLIKATTPIEREQNRQTLATAQAVKAKRLIDIQNGEYGFSSRFKSGTLFLDYYRSLCDDRRENKGSWNNWRGCLRHLERYCDERTTFKNITPEWIDGFKNYLNNVAKDTYKSRSNDFANNKPLSQNSKASYFNKLMACINQAFKEKIIPINPLIGIDNFRQVETKRVYLTFDEVKMLSKTECRYPVLKCAFLFSCLTGLRKSDIEKMTWGEVQKFGEYTRIIFKQKKTGGQEYLDINKQADAYMGYPRKNTDLVFEGFKYSSLTLLELRHWAINAGISKDFTFHAGRHTFAVMMLDLGADIYTVSKLLGHKNLSTTQVYAKVLDKKKQEAINLIPDINL